MSVADWMQKTRVDKNPQLTQQKLAQQMGIDVGSLSRWERGLSEPSDAHMRLWALTLGVPVEEALAQLEGKPLAEKPAPPPSDPNVTTFANEKIQEWAAESKLEPGEWISRFADWLAEQSVGFRHFVLESVRTHWQAQDVAPAPRPTPQTSGTFTETRGGGEPIIVPAGAGKRAKLAAKPEKRGGK